MAATAGVLSCAAGITGAIAGALCARRSSGRHVRKQLNGNWGWMTQHERALASALLSTGNGHLLKGWARPGVNDPAKRALLTAAARSLSEAAPHLEVTRLRCLEAPVAAKHNKALEIHGDVRTDPYYWLRDDKRSSPAVLNHLDAENAYTRAVMADTEQLQETLYQEMRGRIQEADQSVPVRLHQHYYYTKTLEGQQYKIHCRRPLPPGAGPAHEAEAMDESLPEEVLLDENLRKAEGGHTFYSLGELEVSPDQRLLAWSEDTQGGERYTLRVKDLASGQEVMAPIPLTSGSFQWAADNQHLFFVTLDQQERPYKVWRHRIGHPGHEAVYVEEDESFYLGIGKSRSEKVLLIESGSSVTTEYRFIYADQPTSEFKVVLPRVNDVQYSVYHHGDHFLLMLRNSACPNSELRLLKIADLDGAAAAADAAAAAPPPTLLLLAHSGAEKLEELSVSRGAVVVFKRRGGLQCASVHALPAGGVGALGALALASGAQEITFPEPAYSLGAGSQGDFDSCIVRLTYTSLSTPTSTIDYNMVTGARSIKKVQPVLGGFKQEDYVTERQWATSHDGVKVPLSIVYKKDRVKLDGSDPLLLNGYGSYEICNDPWFDANRLCLLDRGFIFAVAHVRGGGEMGRAWYEDGKYLKKKNTFLDLVACAEHLVKSRYTSPGGMSVEGRSAGGLLAGAVCNMRPDLFKAAILGVPFVDVLTTMLDDTIPLTVIEWEEWGNPHEPDFYRYMKTYAPMDNVRAAHYPNMLVTGGLHDPRVPYWEPAKLVARLRDQALPGNLLLLKMELGAGHFSVTGRFERLKEAAFEYAFLLKATSLQALPLGPDAAAPGEKAPGEKAV